MAITDSIADMLTVMRNANSAKKSACEVKSSRMAQEILRILKDEGFISNFKVIKDNKQGLVRIYLKRSKEGKSALVGLRRISTPGLRIYKKADELPKVYSGLGVAIISTSKGMMTDKDARQKKLGGEIICAAW